MQKEREENLLATSLCHRKMWAARLQQLPFVLKFTNLVLAQFVNKARRGSIASVMGTELPLSFDLPRLPPSSTGSSSMESSRK